MVPFILIVVGVLLIIANFKLRNEEKKEDKKEDKSNFTDIFNDKHDNMTEVQLQIGEIRKDVAESLTEVQRDLEDLKKSINSIKNRQKYYDNKIMRLEKALSVSEQKIKESKKEDIFNDMGEFDNQANERKFLLDIYKEDMTEDNSSEVDEDNTVDSSEVVEEDFKVIPHNVEIGKENSKIDDNKMNEVDKEEETQIEVHKAEQNIENDSENIEEEVNTIIPDRKAEKIQMLLEEGIEDKEICRILSVSNGEVELVKGLIKNEERKKN